MPVHDWSSVEAGIYHAFHTAWITHLQEALNGEILPEPFYALAEQHAGRKVPDVLALQADEGFANRANPGENRTVALLDAPPQVGRRLIASAAASYRSMRRTLTIRHGRGDRVVAIIEITSPGNKDRSSSVEDLVTKVIWAIEHGIHVVLIDVLRPGKHDPRGIHGDVWAAFDDVAYVLPEQQPLSVASYMADRLPEAHVVHLACGETLPEMPLFLQRLAYVLLPVEGTYMAAFRGMPYGTRSALERQLPAK